MRDKVGRDFVLGVAGGGSGGHSVPLLAIADELQKQNPQADIFFVTTQKSVEEDIIRKRGFRYFKIPSGKLNGQSLVTTLQTLFKLPFAVLQGVWIVLRNRPDTVLSAGGYAGAPFILASYLMGVRTVIYEQNRVPGMANRLMSRFARLVLLNYESAKKNFPKNETAVVGLPCREEIAKIRWDDADQRWESETFRIFVTGGSQGAIGLNRMITRAIAELGEYAKKIEVHHQSGKNDIEQTEADYASSVVGKFKVEAYVHDMQAAYADAHLVICRSGASTLVELSAAAKAAILVPLVSKDNHQVPNAEDCQKEQAAILIMQSDDAFRTVAAEITNFMHDRNRLKAMAKKMGMRYVPGATSKILAYLQESQ